MFNDLFFSFFLGTEMSFKEKVFEHQTWNFELFLDTLLNSEIMWMKIGQVIRLQNDINFSETHCTSQMISNIFFNILYGEIFKFK